jgi:acetolactate synthase-1/2/3 large subunit
VSETVATAVADELANAGVDRAFGLPGGEVLPLIDALRNRGIEFVLCRHEADAGLMAAVYGKLVGHPGVVVATLGPGASNLLLPVANSLLDREPLVAISAQVPASWRSSRIHQRLPILDVYRPVTKAACDITPANCRAAVRSMLGESIAEPAGPTYLTLSADVSRDVAGGYDATDGDAKSTANGLTLVSSDAAASAVRTRLAGADRPVVVVGIGADWSLAPLLRRWLSDWKLPVAVTPKAKGIVDATDPLFAGVVGGMAIDRIMGDGLGQSDLIIGVGLDPTEIDGDWHERLPMLWVLESAWATNVIPVDNLVATDLSAMLHDLSSVSPPRAWSDPMSDARDERQRLLETSPEGDGGYLSPLGSVRALAAALPRETIVTTDVGSHKYLFGQFWPSAFPGTFFMSNGLSGMGYGLPAAMGAKFARPDQPVLAVLGDGGFSMNSQELETARRYGLSMVVVVIADKSYSMIRIGQRRQGLESYGVDFDPIDSVLVAEACGVRGCRATTEAELSDRAREAATFSGVTVIEIPMRADAYAPIV